jgi:hypothetical protein
MRYLQCHLTAATSTIHRQLPRSFESANHGQHAANPAVITLMSLGAPRFPRPRRDVLVKKKGPGDGETWPKATALGETGQYAVLPGVYFGDRDPAFKKDIIHKKF